MLSVGRLSGIRIISGYACRSSASVRRRCLHSDAHGSVLRTLTDDVSGASVSLHRRSIGVRIPSQGVNDPVFFDHTWLRDTCEEESSVESASKQKLFHTSDVQHDAEDGLLVTDEVTLIPSESADNPLPTLRLVYAPQFAVTNAFSQAFSSAPAPSTKPHISNLSLSRLLNHASSSRYARSHGDIGGTAQPWSSKELTEFAPSPPPPSCSSDVVGGASLDTDAAFARPARLSWEALLPTEAETRAGDHLAPSEIALAALVDGLLRDGLAFVTGVPTDKNGDRIDIRDENSPNLARLAEMLGEIRHTFYGSLWNVRSLGASSRNIAYTNLDLGFHMDLCYFQNPPRFQFLHMLRNRVQGGQSLFVDSFAIAEHMWTNHQDQWKVLSCTPVCFEYNNDNRHYRYTHPTFEVAMPYSGHTGPSISPGSTMPRLTAVNYAPPFQGVLPLRWPTDSSHGRTVVASPEQRRAFYSALSTFADLTHAKEYRYERTLQEGECVVFDNRRVLHSRRGFDWDQAAEKSDDDVKRWLKGCYVDGDAIWSTYRVLLAKARGGSLSNV